MGGLDSAVLQLLPAAVLLVVGFALVVVEMYIPGFGAPGIIGFLLLVCGVIALRPTPFQALLIAIVIVALLCIAVALIAWALALLVRRAVTLQEEVDLTV